MRNLRSAIRYSAVTAACILLSALHLAAKSNEGFVVKSDSFKNGELLSLESVYSGFGCEGKNLSPQLSWSGFPEATKSFIVTIYDPDAPTGSGWWHWTVFNLPSSVTSLEEGIGKGAILPKRAIQGRSDYGENAFGGACPPEGDGWHRYIVTVYAMPTERLPIDANASGALVGYFAQNQSIAKAQITAFYGR